MFLLFSKMDGYKEFEEQTKRVADEFNKIDKKETIRLVSHLDADGIAACSILIKALNDDNRKYSISIVQQLTKEVIDDLAKEKYKYFVFTDLGSGQIGYIKERLKDKKIFILDHHKTEGIEAENIVHLNPHLYGLDGSKGISGAGVVYFFASRLDKKIEDIAHIAIVGAIGDVQEDNGFEKLNDDILQIAVKKGKIKVIKGLRIFGAQTKPLHKVLEYSTDPYIPGVSGSESGAIQFLNQIGINPRNKDGWKKIVHLESDELKKLITGIIMKRLDEDKPDDVLGNVYILTEEEKESPTRDAKEFSTLLNACGRMGKASLGIGVCLGDKKIRERAIKILVDYKKEIVNAIRWYEEEKKEIIKGNGYIIVNAEDNIMPTIIGTLGSIISKSNGINEGTFVMTMANLLDGNTKISLRAKSKNIDLRDILKEIIGEADGEYGGHMQAAGAIIPTEKENAFIEKAKLVLGKKAMEEIIS